MKIGIPSTAVFTYTLLSQFTATVRYRSTTGEEFSTDIAFQCQLYLQSSLILKTRGLRLVILITALLSGVRCAFVVTSASARNARTPLQKCKGSFRLLGL